MTRRRRQAPAEERRAAGPRDAVRPASAPVAGVAVQPSRRAVALGTLVLTALCLVAYWNSFEAAFLLDNETIILKDTRLRSVEWQAVRDIFTRHYWWPFLESRLYRPLTTISYWVNYSVLGNGANPFGYHAVNLLLHWINVMIAWRLIGGLLAGLKARATPAGATQTAATPARATPAAATPSRPNGSGWPALLGAALFACHPLTVESVTNVVGRADLLAALSVLGGLWIHRRFQQSTGRAARAWLAALGAVYCAGVFCKESAVVLPAVLFLHDLAFPPDPGSSDPAVAPGALRRSLARAWPAYVAMAPGLLALGIVRWAMFRLSPLAGEFGSDNLVAIAPFWTGVMTAVKVAGYCLALVVWPANLSCDYSYNAVTWFGWTATSGQDPHAWAALGALGALAAAAAVAWRRHRPLFFFLAFAATAFLPTSNLVIPIGAIMAERFMYLPLVGIAAASALAFAAVEGWMSRTVPGRAGRWLRSAVAIAAVLALAALTTRTIDRNEDWTSAARLWTASARTAPDSIKVIRALATLARERPEPGGLDEAFDVLSRGLSIAADTPLPLYHQPASLYEDAGVLSLARAERQAASGAAADAKESSSQAVAFLRRAEAIDQEINRQGRARLLAIGVPPPEVRDTITARIYRNLGAALLAAGDSPGAVAVLTYLQRTQPANWDAHYALGVALGANAAAEHAAGNAERTLELLSQSATCLIQSVLLNSAHAPSWTALGQVYSLSGSTVPAVISRDGKWTPNLAHPAVPAHFREALARLVRQLQEAGLAEEAERWRRRAAGEFRLEPDRFLPPFRP